VIVRRGRNNRTFYKFITKEIFRDDNNTDDNISDNETKKQNLLGKRKRHNYSSPLDYYFKDE
jgi:hypothetical protein